ncbi:MAG: hypothetical protein ACR2J5_02905 [Geodermatophilaceae bacterium]
MIFSTPAKLVGWAGEIFGAAQLVTVPEAAGTDAVSLGSGAAEQALHSASTVIGITSRVAVPVMVASLPTCVATPYQAPAPVDDRIQLRPVHVSRLREDHRALDRPGREEAIR